MITQPKPQPVKVQLPSRFANCERCAHKARQHGVTPGVLADFSECLVIGCGCKRFSERGGK